MKTGCLLLLLLPCTALAQGLPEVLNARNHAMGGAYRALGFGAEAARGNPAALSLWRRYQSDTTATWDAATKFGYLSVGIRDSQSGPVAAALSYAFASLGRGAGRRLVHSTVFALSTPLTEKLFLGASATHLVTLGSLDANGVTADAGLVLRVTDALVLGVSGHNLIDIRQPDAQRYFAAALAFSSGPLVVAFDLRGNFDAPDPRLAYHVGAEYLADTIPIRAGFVSDGLVNARYLSFGFGVGDGNGRVDLSYRHELAGQNGRMVSLTLSL